MYKVYCLKLKGDEEIRYIGIPIQPLDERFRKHFYDNRNDYKTKWLNKYKDNIVIELLEECLSIEEMKEKEIFYISKYKEEGNRLLNMTIGGDGTYGYKHSNESIKKMSGSNNHRYGKPNLINKEKFGIKVEAFIDNEWVLFGSLREAEKISGVGMNTIKKICNGTSFSECGLKFRYHGKEYLDRKIKRKRKDQSIRKKPIECFINESWVEFKSASDAAIMLNLNRARIVSVCTGNRKSTGGYKFRYKIIIKK